MNHIRSVFFSFIILTSAYVTYAQQNANVDAKKDETVVKKEEELAKVIILPFSDRTNSKNFQYMSESLSEAISASMLKNFTYYRVDPNEVKKSTYDVDQYVKKNKIIKNFKKSSSNTDGKRVKTEEELRQNDDQLSFAKKMASNLKSDIVIYGHYAYDNETNELVFSTAIYLVASDAVKELEENKNVVDNTIFKATDKVAKNMVDTINVMIEEASGSKKKLAENEQATKKPGEKKALTKKVGQGPVIDWAAKKVLISLGAGSSLIPAAKTESVVPTEYRINNSYIDVRFWPIRSLQTSLKFSHFELESSNKTSHANLNLNDLMLYGGYGFYIQKRLYTYLDLGAGYYFGTLNFNASGTANSGNSTNSGNSMNSIKTLNIRNPIFGARFGVDLLLTSFLSAGLSTSFNVYYDKPTPIYNLNLLFNLGVTF